MSAPEKTKESFTSNTINRKSDTTQDLQANLERRLELLGPSTQISNSNAKINTSCLEPDQKSNENSMRFDGCERQNITNLSSPRPPIVMNKSILLARIMAAQERAVKQTQQQKISIESSDFPLQLPQSEADNMMNSQDESLLKLDRDTDVAVNENRIKSNESMTTSPVDILDTETCNHISTSSRRVDHQTNQSSYDSSFHLPLVVTEKREDSPVPNHHVPFPSAPPLAAHRTSVHEAEHETHTLTALLQTVPTTLSHDLPMNIETEVIENSSAFDIDLIEFDADGHILSAEEKLKLIEEQRLIYDRIRHETQLNDAAIAAAQAEAFDERVNNLSMSGSAVMSTQMTPEKRDNAATDESSNVVTSATGSSLDVKAPTIVDIGGGNKLSLYGTERTLDAIKDGTAILVQCVSCEEWMQITSSATLMYCPKCKVISEVVRQSAVKSKEEAIRLTIDRKMAAEMQERENQLTRSSTPNGVAQEESNPSNIEGSSFGSFLPSFITRAFRYEDSEMTRPLAAPQDPNSEPEEVNRRNNSQQSTTSLSITSYPGARSESNQLADTATTAVESRYLEDSSLWNYFSSMLSFESSSHNGRNAEIAVSRPPSSFHSTPSNSKEDESSHVQTNGTLPRQESRNVETTEINDESERLILRSEPSTPHTDANIWNASAARVEGRQQPILSCVVNSISHTAIALGSAISSRHNHVDGIDRTSLLVHGQAPRETDDESNEMDGSYRRLM